MTSIELILDEDFAASLETVSDALIEAGFTPIIDAGHLCLASAPGLEQVNWRELTLPVLPRITCEAIAVAGSMPGLALAITPTAELLACHREIHDYVHGIPLALEPSTLPDQWLPLVQVTTDLDGDLTAAADALQWQWPLECAADRVELWIDGMPVGTLA